MNASLPPEEPDLFDLPLQASEPEVTARPPRRAARRAAAGESLPLFPMSAVRDEREPDGGADRELPSRGRDEEPPAPAGRLAPDRPRAVAPPAASAPDPGASLRARALATGGDLVILAAVLGLQLVGTERLGAGLRLGDWPAYAAFLLCFSFLYCVIPLAFWGQTPGMVWAGIAARGRDDEPLAFGQTARRWLGWLLTVALAGLPGLVALAGGRSLADRVSGSRTVRAEPPGSGAAAVVL